MPKIEIDTLESGGAKSLFEGLFAARQSTMTSNPEEKQEISPDSGAEVEAVQSNPDSKKHEDKKFESPEKDNSPEADTDSEKAEDVPVKANKKPKNAAPARRASQKPKTQNIVEKRAGKKSIPAKVYDDPKSIQVNSMVPQQLLWMVDRKILLTKLDTGENLRRSEIIRDAFCNFLYGCDVMCPDGHRFIMTDVDEDAPPKTVHCPYCGLEFPLAKYQGVFFNENR